MSGDDNTLVVAGARAGTPGGGAAHLHLFERDAQGRWQRRQVLEAEACAQFVAGSASLDGAGDTLAVSSTPTAACPAQGGAIEVFARAGTQWQRVARIADEPTRLDQRFGELSLARDGRTLAASVFDAALPLPSPAPWSGRARVYVRDDAGAWTLAAALAPEGSGALRAAFGTPRLSGNGAVLAVQGGREIPNPQDPTAPAQPDSFVALFTRELASGWIARTTVRSTKPQDCCALREDNDRFGASLALDDDGSTLAVGAPGDNSDASDTVGDPGNHGQPDSGAVWIFRRSSPAVWSRQAFVKAPGNTGVDFFGASVALDRDGRTLAATALGQSVPAGVNRNQAADRFAVIEPTTQGGTSFGGAAYVFASDDAGQWTQRATALPPLEPRTHKTNFDVFAMAFAIDTATLVLGVEENTGDGLPVTTSVFVY
jgi:trimeric autotransporter adhesin